MSTTCRLSVGASCIRKVRLFCSRGPIRLVHFVPLLLFFLSTVLPTNLVSAENTNAASGNVYTHLDSSDPFYVNQAFPKLTTPQWVGEPGVDAVVILAIDDMTDSAKYETFLRPVLNRLKQIDGRAPVSIMTRSVTNGDPLVQTWLKEGLSLEVHTLMHPCPLLANGDFEAAATNFYGCLDLLSRIPGNQPVAFRM